MKKTYKNPILLVVNVKPASILNGSPGLTGTYGGGTVLSREASFVDWDQDGE